MKLNKADECFDIQKKVFVFLATIDSSVYFFLFDFYMISFCTGCVLCIVYCVLNKRLQLENFLIDIWIKKLVFFAQNYCK